MYLRFFYFKILVTPHKSIHNYITNETLIVTWRRWIMVDIEFNMENIGKCKCPGCPVQAQSSCAMDKLETLQKTMASDPPETAAAVEQEIISHPENVPGLYCATGKATCEDLNFEEMCQCPKCDIFKENNLESGEPGGYFCAEGKAR